MFDRTKTSGASKPCCQSKVQPHGLRTHSMFASNEELSRTNRPIGRRVGLHHNVVQATAAQTGHCQDAGAHQTTDVTPSEGLLPLLPLAVAPLWAPAVLPSLLPLPPPLLLASRSPRPGVAPCRGGPRARSSASKSAWSVAAKDSEPSGRMPHCRAMELPVVMLSPVHQREGSVRLHRLRLSNHKLQIRARREGASLM